MESSTIISVLAIFISVLSIMVNVITITDRWGRVIRQWEEARRYLWNIHKRMTTRRK